LSGLVCFSAGKAHSSLCGQLISFTNTLSYYYFFPSLIIIIIICYPFKK